MKAFAAIQEKIYTLESLLYRVSAWRVTGATIAFTNGVFDLLHTGHLHSLNQAASEADKLIVAVNSDASVQKLKGPARPVQDEQTRAILLASLLVTDAVIIFGEDTPRDLIARILPDVLVKGGHYTIEQIAGSAEVLANGGRVVINSLVEGKSTTATIEKINSTKD